MSPKKWIEATGAIGIVSKAGRYGGTFAQKDIAFEFASWISAEFKLYIIKDYQRLKMMRTADSRWAGTSTGHWQRSITGYTPMRSKIC